MSNSQSQSETAEVTVSAEVISTITVDKISDIDFGEISAGIQSVIAADGTEAGQINISSTGDGTEFVVSWTVDDMTLSGDTETMSLTLDIQGSDTEGDQTTLFELEENKSYYTSPTTTDRLESVFIGATVDPTSTQSTGEYNSTITFTFETVI